MRFKSLHIANFRGIRTLSISDLRDLVVIAGPNGCGKSAVLDAIRLLKSFYGGYQANEWQQWMGEFQINVGRPEEIGKLFGDPGRELTIRAEIELSDEEVEYLSRNAEEVLMPIVWARVLGRTYSGSLVSAMELRQYGSQVNAVVLTEAAELRRTLVGRTYEAGLQISARRSGSGTAKPPLGSCISGVCTPRDRSY